jgi:CxxC motif-containing protein
MKEMICIVCPNSCRLEVEEARGGLVVRGNKCKRGLAFAQAEMTAPMRTLCSTVATVFPHAPVLPVRTDGEIPKAAIPAVMALLRAAVVDRPLGIGEAVLQDILGTGRNIISTSNVLRETGNAD